MHLVHFSVAVHLDAIKAAVASRGDQLTQREHGYIRAVLAYASGDLFKATEEFCNMLTDYPLGNHSFHTTVSTHKRRPLILAFL